MLPCRSFLVLPTLALLVALGSASPVEATVADSTAVTADSSVSLPRSPDTWSNPTSRHSLLSRRDIWFAAGTVGAIVLATTLDRWAAEEAPENSGATAVRLSHGAEHLGNPLYVLPGILFVHAANALEHRSDRAGSLIRIVEGAGAAVAATSVVKLAVGRARPYETPGDQDVMRPFSGYTAFPSGHTAFAFGLATAIDQETKARWVPYVVYPLAAMVGWSRLRDNKHWLSDVVAGASIGTWTAHKVVRLARRAIRAK